MIFGSFFTQDYKLINKSNGLTSFGLLYRIELEELDRHRDND